MKPNLSRWSWLQTALSQQGPRIRQPGGFLRCVAVFIEVASDDQCIHLFIDTQVDDRHQSLPSSAPDQFRRHPFRGASERGVESNSGKSR